MILACGGSSQLTSHLWRFPSVLESALALLVFFIHVFAFTGTVLDYKGF